MTLLFFLLALFLLPSKGFGQFYHPPISSALGNSGRAKINPSECVFLNPACLPHYRGYEMSLFGQWQDFTDQNTPNTFGFSLSDNGGLGVWPMSFAFLKRNLYNPAYNPESPDQNNIQETGYHLSLAKFIFKGFTFGVGYHHTVYQIDDKKFPYQQLHFAVLYTPTSDIGLTAVAYNLFTLEGKKNVRFLGSHKAFLEKSLALGGQYLLTKKWKFSVDGIYYPELPKGKKLQLGLGIENNLNDFLIFRLGFNKNLVFDSSHWSAGFGLDLPRFRIDYSYRKNPSPSQGSSPYSSSNSSPQLGSEGHIWAPSEQQAHGIDIKIPF